MNNNPVKNMKDILLFSNITEVRFSKTDIAVIPDDIYELTKLYYLDVSFSKLTCVPNSIVDVAALHYLVLYENPFTADDIDSIKKQVSTHRPDVKLLI